MKHLHTFTALLSIQNTSKIINGFLMENPKKLKKEKYVKTVTFGAKYLNINGLFFTAEV